MLEPCAATVETPEEVARAVRQGKDSLMGVLRPGLRQLQLAIEAPMWRIEASNPEAGSTLPCSLRLTLPPTFPGSLPTASGLGNSGFDVEVSAPGALGREAMKAVSRAAYCRLSELLSGGSQQLIRSLVEWVQSTELHDLAASFYQPPKGKGGTPGLVRAFVRFHHVQSLMKRSYMRLWAEDLGVAALLATGQPGMLLAIGPAAPLRAFLDRAMKCCHWGPTPCRIVASSSVMTEELERPLAGLPLTEPGLKEVADAFPRAVRQGEAYNGRDCIDFHVLAQELQRVGHREAAKDLEVLANTAFAHQDGRVEESQDGSGWVGYGQAEVKLAPGGPAAELKFAPMQPPKALPEQAQTAPAAEPEATEATKPLRRWGRQRVRLRCISGIGTAKHIDWQEKCDGMCKISRADQINMNLHSILVDNLNFKHSAELLLSDFRSKCERHVQKHSFKFQTLTVCALCVGHGQMQLAVTYTLLAQDRWCDNLGGAHRLGEDFNGYSLIGCQAQCSKDRLCAYVSFNQILAWHWLFFSLS
eukprot:symbB.v1.2.012026.t1/scaffold791.1/size175533/13